jgi:hypothetical protein
MAMPVRAADAALGQQQIADDDADFGSGLLQDLPVLPV